MKNISILIIAIFLITLVLIFNFFSTPIKINDFEKLKEQKDNTKVSILSKVDKIKDYADYNLLYLENNITIYCKPKCPNLNEKEIEIIGRYNQFYENRIDALKIKEK